MHFTCWRYFWLHWCLHSCITSHQNVLCNLAFDSASHRLTHGVGCKLPHTAPARTSGAHVRFGPDLRHRPVWPPACNRCKHLAELSHFLAHLVKFILRQNRQCKTFSLCFHAKHERTASPSLAVFLQTCRLGSLESAETQNIISEIRYFFKLTKHLLFTSKAALAVKACTQFTKYVSLVMTTDGCHCYWHHSAFWVRPLGSYCTVYAASCYSC